ncbi:MAG TPA: HDIG domain-containing protein [Candidatus Krumholzibacteria bacterium]|nr:HDIG domain-containing protein [Candidatus Krumholzibacteria bacterium]
MALAFTFTAATVVLLPPVRGIVDPVYREGQVADRDIAAPFALRVPLSGDDLRVARARASLSVPPVYRRERKVERELTRDLSALLDSVAVIVYQRSMSDDERVARAAQWLPGLSRDVLAASLEPDGFAALHAGARDFQRAVFARGLIDNSAVLRRNGYREIVVADQVFEQKRDVATLLDQARIDDVVRAEAAQRFPGDKARAQFFVELVRGHSLPNLSFDGRETTQRRESAAASVKNYFEVAKHERIVGRHERVSREQEAILRALEEARAAQSPERAPLAVARAYASDALRVLLMCAMLGVYLAAFQRPVYNHARPMSAVTVLLLLFVGVVAVVTRLGWSPYLAPVAFVSVALAALFGYRLGLVAGAFAAALLPLSTSIGAGPAFVGWVAGAAGIAGIERMRARSRGYSMVLFVAAAYLLGIAAVEASAGWRELARHALWGSTNAVATSVAIVFLLPVLEQIFNRASRFTLLELTDLNKPVLKRLNMEAHGTYHHSMLLGNIVDAIAGDIGADPLRARAMAYYHDIGKVYKPEYYAENQEPGFNKHERITPQMSALILSSHVKDGVDLARQEKLPEVIVDGIREHHGTTLMSYFYHKAVESEPHAAVNRDDFRYPGPRPRSKEAALLMCADAVEAAVRSLKDPTPAHIRAMVARLIDQRAQDGQLDDSGITLADLAVIKDKLVAVMTTVYHKRVAYPGQDREPQRETAADDAIANDEGAAESG